MQKSSKSHLLNAFIIVHSKYTELKQIQYPLSSLSKLTSNHRQQKSITIYNINHASSFRLILLVFYYFVIVFSLINQTYAAFILNQTFTNYTNINFGACLSQDNTIFVSASLNTYLKIYIWNSSINQYSIKQYIMGDANGLQSCDINSNNSLIVSGGLDKTIKIWKLNMTSSNYDLFQTLIYHTNRVNNVRFNTDASIIVGVSLDKLASIWKWDNNFMQYTQYQILTGHGNGIYSCDISSDNLIIVTGASDKSTKIWILSNNGYYALLQTLSFTQSVYSIKLTNNYNRIINGHFLYFTIWIYNSTSGNYYFSQNFTNHTSSVYLNALQTGQYIYTGSSGDYYIGIWKYNQSTSMYTINQILSTISQTYQLVVNQYGSKIFNTGTSNKFYLYTLSLSCSSDVNSNGTNYICNTCNCIQNFYWDSIDVLCKVNCTLDAYSSGSVNTTVCTCKINYYWSNLLKSCAYNCSLDMNSNGLNTNATACQCNTNYVWSNTLNYCSYDCSLDLNSDGINMNPNQCQCKMNYLWSNTLNYCSFNLTNVCSSDPNSNGINLNATICYCAKNYYWSIQFNTCMYNCSMDMNSNGVNSNATSCQCNLNYYWRSSRLDATLYYCHYDSQIIRLLYDMLMAIISTPTISLLFQFIEPFLKFGDDFYYYIYHKRDYNSNLIYFMGMIFNITQNKWIPSYINQYVSSYQNSIGVYAYTLTDIQNKTPAHFSRLNEDIFFLKNTLDYFTATIPLSIIVFMTLKSIYSFKKYKFVSKILYAYSSYCFLLTALVGDNIQYLSFRCFSQIYFLIPRVRFGYVNLVVCYLSLFVIIMYSFGSFFLFKSFFQNKYNELLEVLYPNIRSAVFMSIQLGLNLLSGFVHAALYQSAYTQMSILTGIQIARIILLVYFGNELKLKTFKVLLIYEYLFRLILHIFFMIQLRLIERGVLDEQLYNVFGKTEITLITIVFTLNIVQSTTLLVNYEVKYRQMVRKKFTSSEREKQNKQTSYVSHGDLCHLDKVKLKYKIRDAKLVKNIHLIKEK